MKKVIKPIALHDSAVYLYEAWEYVPGCGVCITPYVPPYWFFVIGTTVVFSCPANC